MAKTKTERGRFSSRKKMEVVLRVLRGDDLDLVSRDAGITAAKLSAWRDPFIASGQAALKSRACRWPRRRTRAAEGLSRRSDDAAGTVAGSGSTAARWRPFGYREIDTMSHTPSPSTQRPYGVVRVCQEWGLSRSTCYQQRTRAETPPATPIKRGPKTLYTDAVLTEHIRQVLATSPFLGEGHRKVWARLRARGIRTSKPRILRLMRQAGLLAPSRAPRVVVPRVHDGASEPDVEHRCDQHGDGGRRGRHGLRRGGPLYA